MFQNTCELPFTFFEFFSSPGTRANFLLLGVLVAGMTATGLHGGNHIITRLYSFVSTKVQHSVPMLSGADVSRRQLWVSS